MFLTFFILFIKNAFLGEKPKYLGGNRNAITDENIGVSKLLGGMCPGCPPKSTPMVGRLNVHLVMQIVQV